LSPEETAVKNTKISVRRWRVRIQHSVKVVEEDQRWTGRSW